MSRPRLLVFVETRSGEQRKLLCRLAEHFYEKGHRVRIAADSVQAARSLDQMLWSFSQESFVPHRILEEDEDPASLPEPVAISTDRSAGRDEHAILLDGSTDLEAIAHPVAVHFVILDDEERKQESRRLWLDARDRGWSLHHLSYAPQGRIWKLLEELDKLEERGEDKGARG